jgi:hypothetical protein
MSQITMMAPTTSTQLGISVPAIDVFRLNHSMTLLPAVAACVFLTEPIGLRPDYLWASAEFPAKALADGQYSAAVAALTAKAKLSGRWVDYV